MKIDFRVIHFCLSFKSDHTALHIVEYPRECLLVFVQKVECLN